MKTTKQTKIKKKKTKTILKIRKQIIKDKYSKQNIGKPKK